LGGRVIKGKDAAVGAVMRARAGKVARRVQWRRHSVEADWFAAVAAGQCESRSGRGSTLIINGHDP